MKQTSKYTFITIIFVCLLVLNSFAQTDQYSYKTEQPKSLEEVIGELGEKLDIEFSFPSELIKNKIIRKSEYSGNALSELIKEILVDSNLEFQIIDNRKVLLRPKRKLNQTDPKGNNRYKIFGTIQDEEGTPMGFVDVVLDTLFIGSSSDDKGYFEFEIPNDLASRNISFHLVGHNSIIKSIKENEINSITRMSSSVLDIEEVIIVEKVASVELDTASLSATSQGDYLNNIASAPIISSDITRSLQMTAGIDASNDLDASIRIRGSQDDETLIVLDGIPIYKAEHFYGIFGSINGNHINTVSLYKNNLPIQFGGKTGGLVEMKSKDYFNKASTLIDLNTLTSSITFSAPLTKTLSFIFSGRTTYDNAADSKLFNWIEPSIEEDIINGAIESRPLILNTSPVTTFFDLNGKVIFMPNENHLFSASIFTSQDDYSNVYDISFSNPRRAGTIDGREEFNDREDWKNLGASLQHRGSFNNNWKIDTRLYTSSFDYSGSLNTVLNLNRNINNSFDFNNQKINQVHDWGFHSILSKEINANSFSIGLSAIHHDVYFNYEADNIRNIDVAATGFESAIFTGYQRAITDKWTFNLGGRLNYYSETDQVYFAPRLHSRFKLSDELYLKGAFAKHYQFLREVTFYTRLREPIDIFLLTSDGKLNRTYPVGTSVNGMFGFTYSKNNWALDLELYNKEMNGVVDHTEVVVGPNQDDNKPPVRQNKAIVGKGNSYGADLSLRYQDKIYEGALAYTWSKTTNRFEELFQNKAIPSEDDRRHQLKFTNQIQLGNWSLTGNYVFASGLSQLNLFNQEEAINLSELIQNNTFSKLDPYHRIDLGVSYGFEIQSNKVSIGLSVFNLSNNKNVDYLQYLFAIPNLQNGGNKNLLTGTTTQLLDRTFNLNLKAEF